MQKSKSEWIYDKKELSSRVEDMYRVSLHHVNKYEIWRDKINSVSDWKKRRKISIRMKDYKSWFRNREVLRESHHEKSFTVDDGSVQEEIEDQESHTVNNVIIPVQIKELFYDFYTE